MKDNTNIVKKCENEILLAISEKAHLCHVVTFDIADFVHGTVASEGHSEVVPSQKSSSFTHNGNEFKNLTKIFWKYLRARISPPWSARS